MTFLMQKFQSFRSFAAATEGEGGGEGGEEQKKEPTKSELAAAERAKINVSEPVKFQDDEDEDAGDDNDDAGDDDKGEQQVEQKKEEIEKSQKTEEELEAEKAAAKTQKEKDRVQRKIDKEIAKRKAAEDRVKELEAKLAADPEKDKLLTEEEVNKRARDIAAQTTAEEKFIEDCNKLAKEANKVDKDFKVKIDALAKEIAPIPGLMIAILSDPDNDIENQGDILAHFVKDEDGNDDYERIIGMQNNPAKMAVALTRLSTKIAEAKKPKPKEISKVPEPPETPSGRTNVVNMDLTKAKDQADFNRIRAAQIEQRRKEKMTR